MLVLDLCHAHTRQIRHHLPYLLHTVVVIVVVLGAGHSKLLWGNAFKLPHHSDFAAEDLAPVTATADELAALESASA